MGVYLDHFHNLAVEVLFLESNHLCAEDAASGNLIDEENFQPAGVAVAALVVTVAVVGLYFCLEYDSALLQDYFEAVPAKPGDSLDEAGIEGDQNEGLAVQHGYA